MDFSRAQTLCPSSYLAIVAGIVQKSKIRAYQDLRLNRRAMPATFVWARKNMDNTSEDNVVPSTSSSKTEDKRLRCSRHHQVSSSVCN